MLHSTSRIIKTYFVRKDKPNKQGIQENPTTMPGWKRKGEKREWLAVSLR